MTSYAGVEAARIRDLILDEQAHTERYRACTCPSFEDHLGHLIAAHTDAAVKADQEAWGRDHPGCLPVAHKNADLTARLAAAAPREK
jgi:hypothetical protein